MANNPSLLNGTVLGGDYEIERLLAQGGMGAVYVARQRSTHKQRAIKTMLPELVGDAALRSRFLREATVGARIESDHVLEVLSAGVDEASGIPWLAMEMLTGADLAHTVASGGPLSRSAALELARQLGHALSAAHRANVVHRDLKPENIYLANPKRSGIPFHTKVLDFGIAKLLGAVHTHATVNAMGSPLWMAPEQTDATAGVTPATDLWSVGLIFYFALTGRNFWLAGNVTDTSVAMLIRELIVDPIPTATERAGLFSVTSLKEIAGFDAWFARCVQRDAAKRFQHAEEAFAALVSVLEGRGFAHHDTGVGIGFASTLETPAHPSPPVGGSSASVSTPSPHNLQQIFSPNATHSTANSLSHTRQGTDVGPPIAQAMVPTSKTRSSVSSLPYVAGGALLLLVCGGIAIQKAVAARDTHSAPLASVQNAPSILSTNSLMMQAPIPLSDLDSSIATPTQFVEIRPAGTPNQLRVHAQHRGFRTAVVPGDSQVEVSAERPAEDPPHVGPAVRVPVVLDQPPHPAVPVQPPTPTVPERTPEPAPVRVCPIGEGPLWNNNSAQEECPRICGRVGGRFTRVWRTTIPNTMSTCDCEMPPGRRCP